MKGNCSSKKQLGTNTPSLTLPQMLKNARIWGREVRRRADAIRPYGSEAGVVWGY